MAETEDTTKDELYEKAQKKDIEGRSEMSKAELAKALKKDQKSSDLTPLAQWRQDQGHERG